LQFDFHISPLILQFANQIYFTLKRFEKEVKDVPESYKRYEELKSEKENATQSGTQKPLDGIDEHRFMEGTTENENEGSENTNEIWQNDPQSAIAEKMTGTMADLERIQETEFAVSDEVKECIQDCVDCFKICNETIIRCLVMNGKHSESEHINLLMDCARICNTNSEFMMRNSMYYPQTCGLTADICDECADTCDRFEEDFMKECASVCRRCAESCREMAK
jgi:hypothetical protein